MSPLDPLGPFKRAFMLVVAVLLAGLLVWLIRMDHLRAGWKSDFEELQGEAGGVLTATRIAAENPQLSWDQVQGQVAVLGEEKRALGAAIRAQNAAINDLAEEAVRLKAEAAELQRIADRAQAQRQAALTRLADLSITPGTRTDCQQLLAEAEEALDLVYEAGL